MNAQLEEFEPFDVEMAERQKWEMKALKPKHRQVCSMLAQGIARGTIAKVIGCTPEYITMLSKQKLMQDYMKELCQQANLQLEAMYVQSVDAIGDVLREGQPKERLQAARLQMEATKRIGSGAGMEAEVIDTNSRLTRLAERLLALKTPSYREPITVENNNG